MRREVATRGGSPLLAETSQADSGLFYARSVRIPPCWGMYQPMPVAGPRGLPSANPCRFLLTTDSRFDIHTYTLLSRVMVCRITPARICCV